MFKELFDPNLVFLDFEAANSIDLLEKIVPVLVERDYVNESYLQSIIEREEEYPTGLPTEPYAVAIPHGNPENVKIPCIVVIRPKTGVVFREMASLDRFVEVRYVFLLVINKNEDQVPLLQKMIDMFMREESMRMLDNAGNSHEIIEVLKSHLIERRD